MQSQISEISSVLVEVSVDVPWADVEKAMEGSYLQLGRTARVKGFRPGKVPRTVLKQLFGPRVKHEVVQNLVEAGLGHAVKQHSLTVVAVPPLETMPELRQGEPLSFKAKVEVRPKIESVNIEGIELTRGATTVPDSEVDAAIERMRQGNAELTTPEPMRAAKESDVLTCDYTVSVDGTARPDLSANGRPIDLSGGLLAELREALIGKQPGDKVQVSVTFPADQGGEFAGKPGVFDIEIKELKEKVLPELDDEFAKDLEHESLAALKQKTRDQLEASLKDRVENELRELLVQKLIEKNPIDVPPSLVQQQQQAMLQEMVQLVRQGIQLPPDLIENSKSEAERRVRAALLLGAVARTREIRVEAQDLDKRIEEIAERSGKHVAKVRAELHGEQRERLESQILEEKLLEYLLAQATISEAAT